MAAIFWRWVFCGAVMLDALLSAGCAKIGAWSVGTAVLAGAAVLLLTPYLLIDAALIRAAVANRGGDGAVTRRRDWLRVGLTEPCRVLRALLSMVSHEHSPRPGGGSPAIGGRVQPILLIHGILCNGGVWRDWAEPLRAAGYSCVEAVDLEPIFGDIDDFAADVVAALTNLQHRSGGARVAIIGHSMGGLVARAALRIAGPAVVGSIVTIGSPHHGTAWARNLPFQLTRQMRPGSGWLGALNASQEMTWPVPLTSIYSMQDEFIVPARSAVVSGAQNHELHGLGHLDMITSLECMRLALTALERR